MLLGGIAFVDYLSGPEISFSIFYLLPVAEVAWYVSRSSGVGLSLIAAAAWLIVDLNSGQSYSHPLIPYWNALVRLGFFVLFAVALDRLKGALAATARLARLDPLTGVANPRVFREILSRELDQARRFGRPFTLVFLDCDNFKELNDRRGHGEGDEVLRVVAETITATARRVDVVGRLGGDEFAVLLPETGGSSCGVFVARLRVALAGAMRDREFPITFSIGAATFAIAPRDADEAIRLADQLMYKAKNGGKDAACCVVIADDV
ncbi:MAG: GGDEF domain-containing protein [Acidobacteriota bacterium]